jgi:DMSO/TMAO reductase YedYZ molybdopterin-dependent catalytic subunit
VAPGREPRDEDCYRASTARSQRAALRRSGGAGPGLCPYAMNGEPLPLLNGFPLRLVVPGWYATYWVKMLDDIEVLDKPDDNFWTTKAYLIPDTPFANVAPSHCRRTKSRPWPDICTASPAVDLQAALRYWMSKAVDSLAMPCFKRGTTTTQWRCRQT